MPESPLRGLEVAGRAHGLDFIRAKSYDATSRVAESPMPRALRRRRAARSEPGWRVPGSHRNLTPLTQRGLELANRRDRVLN